jgi:hypothetical protein
MRSVNPTVRRGVIGGRNLVELIQAVLENRIGVAVVSVLPIEGILESLLEEYFYGGTLQDEFYEMMANYRVPTTEIHFTRNEVLRSIADQVRLVFGDIRPCNHYSFEMLPGGDIMVSEETPRLPFKGLRLVG